MAKMNRKYPETRLRRLRSHPSLLKITAETTLTVDDLIQPIFIKEGIKSQEKIDSLPGIFRYSKEGIIEYCKKIMDVGIKAVALFPVIDPSKKDLDGKEAFNRKNLICTCVQAIKKEIPDLLLIVDVALDPYTPHGHDGILNESGYVDNDISLEVLKKQALTLADAGADIIAPSDMMDGRIGIIRNELEAESFFNTIILSYAAKYSSKFYGPFREAVQSSSNIGKSNKDSYQMSPHNIDEALHEVEMDLNEGADAVMVKPGMPYLDVIKAVKEKFKVPTFAYQVSGEYAMLKAAIEKKWLQEEVLIESLYSFKRAGTDCILTYAAEEAAKKLG